MRNLSFSSLLLLFIFCMSSALANPTSATQSHNSAKPIAFMLADSPPPWCCPLAGCPPCCDMEPLRGGLSDKPSPCMPGPTPPPVPCPQAGPPWCFGVYETTYPRPILHVAPVMRANANECPPGVGVGNPGGLCYNVSDYPQYVTLNNGIPPGYAAAIVLMSCGMWL